MFATIALTVAEIMPFAAKQFLVGLVTGPAADAGAGAERFLGNTLIAGPIAARWT
jgi:hypothetical protein